MSGLSVTGTGISGVKPLSGGSYGGGITITDGYSLISGASVANPASGLALRGVALSLVGGPTIDPNLALWMDAVIANGGTVSAGRQAIINTFIAAEKAAGAWTPTDDYLLLCAENEPQALTSLKQRRLATLPVAPTFTIDRGYAFNGTTQYINTGFIPSTHAVAMTVTNVRVALYDRANVASNAHPLGAGAAANINIRLRPRTVANTMISDTNTTGGTFSPLPANDSRGYSASSRNGPDATTVVGYKNGVALTRSADPTGFGASLVGVSIFIGGYNAAGVLTLPRNGTIGLVAVGAALTAGQELAQYNNVQAWATSIGANV